MADPLSPAERAELEAADRAHREASRVYDRARVEYRAGRLGDEPFLELWHAHRAALERWEVAVAPLERIGGRVP